MVKVSVIMPVYNCEDFLNDSIGSILNQSLDDLELICVDDGSDDNSLNILKNYENNDSRVKVFSINHTGGGNARNFALNFVSGEYLYFMDADDVLDLNAFEDFYSISESKNLDFLMFKAKKFDVVNNFSFEHDYYNMASLSSAVKGKVFNFNDIGELIFDINVTPWCKFYNAQFIKNSKAQFRNNSKFHDNQFFWDIIFQAKRIYFLDEFYYIQNVNPNSLIELADEKHCDAIDVLNGIDDLFKKHNQFERFKMQLYDRKVFLQVMRYGDIMDEYKELYFQKMKKDLMRFKNTDFRDYLVHSRKYIFDCVLSSKNHDDFDPLREYYYILLNESSIDEKLNQVKHCFENLSKNHRRFVFNYIKNDFSNQDLNSENNEFFNIFNYKISIIIPVFNGENFIDNAFDSILNQTIGFENLEVIFVDDASSDSTPKIIKEYSEKYENVISICLDENSGYAGLPRNIGMKYATSDYLMFLDADDIFLKDACAILYNEIVSDDIDIAYGVHSDGKVVPKYLLRYILTDFQASSNNPAKNIDDLVHDSNFEIKINSIDEFPSIISSVNVWDKIFKKSFIVENKITFPDAIPAEDSLFLLNAFISARGIKFINKIIAVHDYQRYGSVSHQFSKTKIMKRIKAYFMMFYLCIEKNKTEIFKRYLLVAKLTYLLVDHIWKCNLPISDILEILIYAKPLFKLYVDYSGVIPENLEVFEYIADEDYENALKFLFNDAICQKDIKVATMLDSFLHDSFKYEFDSIELHPDIWLNQFENEKPDLFMYGLVKDEILEKDSQFTGPSDHILSDILKYCNQNNVPTVFLNSAAYLSYNHSDINIENALKFDYIFSDCEEAVQNYKLKGHENVYLLGNAIQPKFFNPIKKDKLNINSIFEDNSLDGMEFEDILENHTYSNWFRQILDAINFKYVPDLKDIILFYRLDDLSDLIKITKHFYSINYPYKHLKLITDKNNLFLKEAILESDLENIELKDNCYFSFADLNLCPDFVKKALLHFQYVGKDIGIKENAENKYCFEKTEDINNIIFYKSKYFELISNKSNHEVFYI